MYSYYTPLNTLVISVSCGKIQCRATGNAQRAKTTKSSLKIGLKNPERRLYQKIHNKPHTSKDFDLIDQTKNSSIEIRKEV